jgi:hypothetical protein
MEDGLWRVKSIFTPLDSVVANTITSNTWVIMLKARRVIYAFLTVRESGEEKSPLVLLVEIVRCPLPSTDLIRLIVRVWHALYSHTGYYPVVCIAIPSSVG